MRNKCKATFFVCDDLLFSLHGKMFPHGIYTGDIGLPTPELILPQLVFVFFVEIDIHDPCRTITVRVKFPGSDHRQADFSVASPPPIEGRVNFIHKIPLVVSSPVLIPGVISAHVLFDDEEEEIEAGQQWIVLTSSAQKEPAQKKRKT